MRVSHKNLKTPVEELDALVSERASIGDFFPWDVHPNVLRQYKLREARLTKKIFELVDSSNYKQYIDFEIGTQRVQ